MARHFFDRQGKPITAERCLGLLSDSNYLSVALDTLGGDSVPDANTGFVRTTWLGFDPQDSPEGAPLIFETDVWRYGELVKRYRWSTEAEALAGHQDAVKLMRAMIMEDALNEQARIDAAARGIKTLTDEQKRTFAARVQARLNRKKD